MRQDPMNRILFMRFIPGKNKTRGYKRKVNKNYNNMVS